MKPTTMSALMTWGTILFWKFWLERLVLHVGELDSDRASHSMWLVLSIFSAWRYTVGFSQYSSSCLCLAATPDSVCVLVCVCEGVRGRGVLSCMRWCSTVTLCRGVDSLKPESSDTIPLNQLTGDAVSGFGGPQFTNQPQAAPWYFHDGGPSWAFTLRKMQLCQNVIIHLFKSLINT